MSRKILFSNLDRTCIACPSQWEYFQDGYGAYVRYRHNELTVYINQTPVRELFDCIEMPHRVLCIDELSSDPNDYDCGYLTDEKLFDILKHHNLLEEE
jgi:hypothetical protein